MSIDALAAGFAIGLSVAVPVGPMGLLCIERTLSRGFMAGIATGVAAATVHGLYGATAAWSLEMVKTFIALNTPAMSLISAAVLAWFSWRCMRRRADLGLPSATPTAAGLLGIYAATIAFALVNPLTIVLLAAAVGVLTPADAGPVVPIIGLGILLGSCTWWLILSTSVALLRSRLQPRLVDAAFRLSGLALGAAACGVLMRAARLA